MKIASFKKVITCQIGDDLGGYGNGITSVAIHDELFLRGLCMDDGEKRVLMLSYDLIAIDLPDLQKIRVIAKEELKLEPADVVISCTHNHSGPQTRWLRSVPLNDRYMKDLTAGVVNIINLLQPDVLAIGGGLSGVGNVLLDELKKRVKPQVYSLHSDIQTDIRIASLGNEAGIIGAVN